MVNQHSECVRISRRYARFAADEARGASEIYERLSLAVAASPNLLMALNGRPGCLEHPAPPVHGMVRRGLLTGLQK